jgi:hypothetical protein
MTELILSFLHPALHSTEYGRAFGTLYTAVYRRNDGVVDYLWASHDSWLRAFDSAECDEDSDLEGIMTTFEASEPAGRGARGRGRCRQPAVAVAIRNPQVRRKPLVPRPTHLAG